MVRRDWGRDEQLLALRLYCLLPFGQLHQKNKEVIAVATAIGRTPSVVAMKACDFASLDSAITQNGLGNSSRADRVLWESFMNDSEAVIGDAEELFQKLVVTKVVDADELLPIIPQGPTESVREVRVRRVQQFFRNCVLIGYKNQCAISGLDIPGLLIASHIIPWSENESRRADPANGVVLNSLYDAAFDKGFMTFDDDFRVVLSRRIIESVKTKELASILFDIKGKPMTMPSRFLPDISAIRYHRNNIFIDDV
ncbi:HNH endonuclease [Sulfuriflexus sp.]|uniref:HNH endonuclease n=1 Tax=Sulfuriflexus sp. TaxID=2015443 RepID=UPI0028CE8D5B|nr:HNH endonuclease [Sulfuriflexus sp.]MDT8404767.1 HNH endonuclease [Sulfuriflexus sp.]